MSKPEILVSVKAASKLKDIEVSGAPIDDHDVGAVRCQADGGRDGAAVGGLVARQVL